MRLRELYLARHAELYAPERYSRLRDPMEWACAGWSAIFKSARQVMLPFTF